VTMLRRVLLTFALVTLLAAGGCNLLQPSKPPAELKTASVAYSTDGSRLEGIKTTLNDDTAPPSPPADYLRLGDERTAVCIAPSFREDGETLLDYLRKSLEYLQGMSILGIPALTVHVHHADSLPRNWVSRLAGERLTFELFFRADTLFTKSGRWTRMDDGAASQLLGTFHELVEMSLMYGRGARIPYGNDEKARWLREGIATYLAEQTLRRCFVCNPYLGSRLSDKYYYATKFGAKLLQWKEASGGSWNEAYGASLGFVSAAYDGTGGKFPREFLRNLAEASDSDATVNIMALLDECLGCTAAEFAASVRRPLPELLPESADNKLKVPAGFAGCPDAPGLAAGDEIIAVDGKRVFYPYDLDEELWKAGAKDSFNISIRRHDAAIDVVATPIGFRSILERSRR